MPPIVLEDFTATTAASAPAPSEEEIEAMRRNAYENGFHAGAADAIAAAQAEQAQLSSDLASAIQELSFTFHEAAAHVMTNVTPVLEALVDAVLPQVMAETVGRTILEEMQPHIEAAADIPARILVSPDEAPALRHVLGEDAEIPFVIVEDPALKPGQAHLRVGAVERQIDVAGVLDRISGAVGALSELNERKTVNA